MGPEPEAAYAALCATYAPRNPFREFGHGVIDLNALRVLIQGLPLDSALHRAIPEMQGWTPTEYLLAEAINAVNWTSAILVAVNSESGSVVAPEPVETPEIAAKREAERLAEEHAQRAAYAWFESQFQS